VRGRVFALGFIAALIVSVPAAAAKSLPVRTSASNQLVANGSFETSLAGWGTWNSTISRVSGGVVGNYAALVKSSRGWAFSIDDSPDSVANTVAGSVYSATAWIKTPSDGLQVCLSEREWKANTVVGSTEVCVAGSSSWQVIGPVAYTALAGGHRLDVYAFAKNAHKRDSFLVDGIAITADVAVDSTPPPPPPLPPPPAADPLPQPASLVAESVTGTSLGLAWTAPADSRIVAYRVSADGSTLGTTTGLTYAVSGLQCGTAHTFAVSSLDLSGGASAPASVSATTAACPPSPVPVPVPPTPAGSCSRYASTSGSDSGAGTVSNPYRTVQKLMASLVAGETGCLQPGTYAENVKVTRGGLPGSRITLTSAAERATILGLVEVTDAANDITFTNLALDGKNSTSTPSPVVNGDRITFSSVDVTNEHTAICFNIGTPPQEGAWGLALDVVIDSSRIHDCGKIPATNLQHGIYVDGGRNVRITNNYIYNNADFGVHLYPDAQNTVVEHNVIDGNGEGLIFAGDLGVASSNNLVRYNVISNSLIRYDVEGWWKSGNPIGSGNRVDQNCLWNGKQGTVSSDPGFTVTNSITSDPLYVNRAAGDFRLQSSSPCAGYGPTG
jgi:parallel beta-helix repeat protein